MMIMTQRIYAKMITVTDNFKDVHEGNNNDNNNDDRK